MLYSDRHEPKWIRLTPPRPYSLWDLPRPYPMNTRGFCPEVKRSEREVNHSPPCSAEVKNAWNYICTSPYAYMACYLVKRRDKLHFSGDTHTKFN